MRDWLVDLRRARGLSQKEVAAAVGIAQPSYWEIEHGLTNPKLTTACRLGELLGFDWRMFIKNLPETPERNMMISAETR